MPPPLVFLSHSGADTEAARALKRRLMDAPDAKAAARFFRNLQRRKGLLDNYLNSDIFF